MNQERLFYTPLDGGDVGSAFFDHWEELAVEFFHQYTHIDITDPPQNFMNRWNVEEFPFGVRETPAAPLFREVKTTLTNNDRIMISDVRPLSNMLNYTLERFLSQHYFGQVMDLNSPGVYYFKIHLIGKNLKYPNAEEYPIEVVEGFQLPLPVLTVNIPQPGFIGMENDPGSAFNNWIKSLIPFFRDQVVEKVDEMENRGQINSYRSTLAINILRLTIVRAPENRPYIVGCNTNSSESQQLKRYTFEGDNIFAHVASSKNNNCFFFPLCFSEFKSNYPAAKSPVDHFFAKKKREFLSTERTKLFGIEPDSEEAINWAVDIKDFDLLRDLCFYFKTHLLIFHLKDEAKDKWEVDIYFDSRRDLLLRRRGMVTDLPYFSFVIDKITLRENTNVLLSQHHVFPIVNDNSSVYNKWKKLCPKCNVVYSHNPYGGKREQHRCNIKKLSFQRKHLALPTILNTPEFLDTQNKFRMIEMDAIDPDNPREKKIFKRIDFPLTCPYAIPESEPNFGKCKYSKEKHAIFYDFETLFQNHEMNEAKVYAVGFLCWWDEKYIEYYGEDSLDHFLDFLLKLEFGVKLVAYNGAKFDAIILARASISKKWMNHFKIHSFMVNAGELLSFALSPIHDETIVHTPWDLYKFTLSSLAKACKSSGCHFQKSIFPHDFVKDWDSLRYIGPLPETEFFPKDCRQEVESRRKENPDEIWNLQKECLDYLKLDVMSLFELFNKEQIALFSIVQEEGIEEFHLLKFFSISQFANELANHFWRKKGVVIYPPPDVNTYDLFKSGYLGGKVDYGCRFWQIDGYDMVVKDEGRFPENKKIYDTLDDYLTYQDVTSLYPSVMMAYFYPMGPCVWFKEKKIQEINQYFNNCEMDYQNGSIKKYSKEINEMMETLNPFFRNPYIEKDQAVADDYFGPEVLSARGDWKLYLVCSYWEVTYCAPFDTRFPVHMYKTKSGKLQTDLFPNRGWFYSPDIFSMIENGYCIHHVHNILTWTGFSRHLKDVMEAAKKIKDKGTEIKDETLRTKGKTLLNSLYGKFGQQTNDKKFEICHTIEQFIKFISENVWTESINCHGKEDDEFVTFVKGVRKEAFLHSRKPTYLAGFVTAYSRMQNRRSIIDPIVRNDPGNCLIGYHDTDSFCIRKKDYDAIDDKWKVFPGKSEVFGQVKDDLASSSKHYQTLKTNLPVKIIRLMVIGKKVYHVEFLLPDGTLERTSACKGISQEVDQSIYEAVLMNPSDKGETFTTPFSLTKTFFTTQSMKRKRELWDEEIERKKLKICEENGNTIEAADMIDELEKQHTCFMIQKVVNTTRTFNKTPPDYRFIDLNTGLALPWGHKLITSIDRQTFKDIFKVSYKPEAAIRFTYRCLPQVNLTLEGLRKIKNQEEGRLMQEETGFGFNDVDYYQ